MRLIVAAREANESEPPVKLSHSPPAPSPHSLFLQEKKKKQIKTATCHLQQQTRAEGDVLAAGARALASIVINFLCTPATFTVSTES